MPGTAALTVPFDDSVCVENVLVALSNSTVTVSPPGSEESLMLAVIVTGPLVSSCPSAGVMFSITGAGSCSVNVCVLLVVVAPY
jgi:hypothetical protein